MDVNILNNLPIPKNYINTTDARANLSNETEFLFKHDKNQMNFENVLMNIEDVKNFLYMLIGGGNVHLSPQGEKGLNINKTA